MFDEIEPAHVGPEGFGDDDRTVGPLVVLEHGDHGPADGEEQYVLVRRRPPTRPISINAAVLAGAAVAWLVSKTGGSDKVRDVRAEQGILIASGLMAGAAIFGIISAVFRVPKLGALIQYVSVGVDFWLEDVAGTAVLEEHAHVWYTGFEGQMIGLVMLIVLAFACFLLARLGAKWMLDSEGDE